MTLWIVLTALAAAIAIALTASFTRRPNGIPIVAEADAEADTAAAPKDILPRVRSIAMVAVAGLVVVASAGLYVVTGKPGLASKAVGARTAPVARWPFNPGQPHAMARAANRPAVPRVEPGIPGTADELIVNLAARLQNNPDDAKGWRMLGWSYFNTQRYQKAAEAYGRAIALQGDDSDLQSAYGESLVRAADGLVMARALEVFDTTLALNPRDVRARFFKGLALAQAGQPNEAIDAWLEIIDDAPAGADWIDDLRLRVRELAAASSIDITGRLSGAPERGPTAAQRAAAQSMTPEDRQAMIRSMVDRLASRLDANPDDADGWIKLMRSRIVLGEQDAALTALRRANAAFSGTPDTQARIADAAAELGLSLN